MRPGGGAAAFRRRKWRSAPSAATRVEGHADALHSLRIGLGPGWAAKALTRALAPAAPRARPCPTARLAGPCLAMQRLYLRLSA